MSPLAQKICDLINTRPGASFVEIANIEGCAGNFEMYFSGHENIVLWAGLSKEAIEAIDELRVSKRIRIEPSIPMVYLIDGGALKYPLAKSARAYKTPHWLPVVFWPEKVSQTQQA